MSAMRGNTNCYWRIVWRNRRRWRLATIARINRRTANLPATSPSVTVLYEQLTPYTLGGLIALCEHRTFVEGVIWGINSLTNGVLN